VSGRRGKENTPIILTKRGRKGKKLWRWKKEKALSGQGEKKKKKKKLFPLRAKEKRKGKCEGTEGKVCDQRGVFLYKGEKSESQKKSRPRVNAAKPRGEKRGFW